MKESRQIEFQEGKGKDAAGRERLERDRAQWRETRALLDRLLEDGTDETEGWR